MFICGTGKHLLLQDRNHMGFLHRIEPQELLITRSTAKTAWYLRMLLKQRKDLGSGVHTLTQPYVRQPACYLATTEGY